MRTITRSTHEGTGAPKLGQLLITMPRPVTERRLRAPTDCRVDHRYRCLYSPRITLAIRPLGALRRVWAQSGAGRSLVTTSQQWIEGVPRSDMKRVPDSKFGGRPLGTSSADAPAAVASDDRRISPQLLDVASLATRLGVTERFIRRLIAERRVPFCKIGKFVRFDPLEIEAWLNDRRINAIGHD